jgi:hypothetical protein
VSDPHWPDYPETIAAIISCDVPEANVSIAYDELLQSDVVRISDVGGDDEERLRCLMRSIHPFYIVEIEEPQQNDRYRQLVLEEQAARARVEGEKWLQERGLFAGAPPFDADTTPLADYARAVETHCGLEPGSALEILDEQTLTPRQSALASLLENDGEKLTCVMHVIALSGDGERQVAFGFLSEPAVASNGTTPSPNPLPPGERASSRD